MNYSPPQGNSGTVPQNYYYPEFVPYTPWYPYQPWYPPVYPAAPQVSPQGWVCPLCGAANAPHVNQCSCTPTRYVWTCINTDNMSLIGASSYDPVDKTHIVTTEDGKITIKLGE